MSRPNVRVHTNEGEYRQAEVDADNRFRAEAEVSPGGNTIDVEATDSSLRKATLRLTEGLL